MPCPYFGPVEHLDSGRRMPLGDAYSGLCHAHGAAYEPDRAALLDCCNLGYARGRCSAFPDDEGPDAVRFAISSHQDGMVRIRFCREKDHLPFDQGWLEYKADGGLSPENCSNLLLRQAEAYLDSYFRRKHEQTK